MHSLNQGAAQANGRSSVTPQQLLDRLVTLIPIAIGITACPPSRPLRAAVTARTGLPMGRPVPS
jgi:hypothetical protein